MDIFMTQHRCMAYLACPFAGSSRLFGHLWSVAQRSENASRRVLTVTR
jgi:hypothetical protein